ncbi:hypothetical protein I3760_14G007700 [Carya illinoinensis]|nr:hypothetical protein I3760_14G007700 [Carya illinoinensis]
MRIFNNELSQRQHADKSKKKTFKVHGACINTIINFRAPK